MKNFIIIILILSVIVIQIPQAFAQPNPCTPGCSMIANGNFEQPNDTAFTNLGIDHYHYSNNSPGMPFNYDQVQCWHPFSLTPHLWPVDTSSIFDHFAVMASNINVADSTYMPDQSEIPGIKINSLCIDSGISYKIRFEYSAYGDTSIINHCVSFAFTDNQFFAFSNPSSSDNVVSKLLDQVHHGFYNPSIIPPTFESSIWHYTEVSEPILYSGQESFVISPTVEFVSMPAFYGPADYLLFIDSISFIPYIEFEIDTLCGSSVLYEISPLNLPTGYSISYESVLSGNLSIVQTTGNTCIFSLDNYTYGQGSSIKIQYLLHYQACNDENCSQSDTLSEILFPYHVMEASTVQIQEVSCIPNCDGIAEIVVLNGTSPFQYLWSNSVTTNSNSTLCAGLNYVTVTDAMGCWMIDSIQVTDTTHFEILGYKLGLCACDDSSYAFIPIDSMQNGVAPFSYLWFTNPTQTNDTLMLNGPGVYSVSITDSFGCTDIFQFEEYCIELDSFIIHNSHCEESCDGVIGALSVNWLSICPPCPDVTYTWSNGLISNGEAVTGFCPGLHTVTITDCNGNYGVDTVLIGFDYDPYLSVSLNGVSCPDICDGFVEVTLINSPLNVNDFELSSSNGYYQFQDDVLIPLAEFDSLCLGNYTIIVSNRHGCRDTLSFILPSEFYNSSTFTTNSCSHNSIISIDITTLGPNSPFTYLWSNGSTLQDITVPSPGIYSLTTTDADTCVIIETFIFDSIPLSAAINPIHPTCATIANGQLEIIASGGMPPYSYAWSTGASTGSVTGLAPGFYSVTTTDSYGCSTEKNITLGNYLYLEATSTSYPPTCPDVNSNSDPGSIELTIQDGVPPYTFLWSNNETNQNLITSIPGYYSVTISDSVGCQIVLGDSIQDISLAVLIHDIGQGCSDTTSNLLENASATANILGGVGPFTYIWSNSTTESNIQDLIDFNNYSVTVTDANGCTGVGTVEVKSEQTINLRNGHSMWSTYIDLESQTIEFDDLFDVNGLSSSIIIMKDDAGFPYWPTYSINLIGVFKNGEAYYAKMPFTGTYSFKVTGNLICPEDYDLNINQGWSYIAYLRTSPSSPQTELAAIASNTEILKNSDGAIYWATYNLNLIGNMIPGEGYNIKMNLPAVLNYSPNSTNLGTKSVYPSEDLIPDNSDIITENFMILGIPNEAWITEPNFGEMIIVKGEKGQIVGRAYYWGEFTALCLYGDDSSTPLIKEGLANDESFTIEIYSQSNKIYQKADISLKSWEQGNGRFLSESIAVLKPDVKVEIDNSNKILGLQVFPNPNAGDFKIEFYSMQEGMAKIRVIDNLGRALFISENKNISKGSNYLDFALKNISSGTYFLELSIGDCQELAIFNIVNK